MDGISSYLLEKLYDYILGVLENKNNAEDNNLAASMKGLKFICYGAPEEECLSLLTPQEKLSSIVRINDFNVIFAMQPDDCINTVETLLSYSQLTFDLCKAFKTLIPTALKIKSNKNLSIINKLFSHKDFPMVPVDLIEEIITLDSTQLELLIIELYSKQCNHSEEINLWNSDTSKHWIYLCSVSPKLFYILISIMNLVLVAAKNRKAMLNIILNFIVNISQMCQQGSLDFVSLYPTKLQHLVNLMSLDVEQLPAEYVLQITKLIFEQINTLKNENVFHALLLLTHFGKWENFNSWS